MPSPTQDDAALAIQGQQQQDAERQLQRLEQIDVADLTVNYRPEKSCVVLPAVLVRLLTLAVLFRLNSAKKWRLRPPILAEIRGQVATALLGRGGRRVPAARRVCVGTN